MNTNETNQETSRPFGYWLKATDRLMAAEFAAAFESFGVTRRDWRLLNRIDGTVADGDRPLPVHKLSRLIELDWVTDADGTWTLTNEGRNAKDRLGVIVDGIRSKVTDAVPTEDLATTMATLEQIARAFGWDESTPLPRGRGHRHGHARRYGHDRPGHGPHGFGMAREFAPRHSDRGAWGFGGQHFDGREARFGEHPHAHRKEQGRHVDPSDGGHKGCHGHRPGRARFARFAQGVYERGFDAGFSRGREDR